MQAKIDTIARTIFLAIALINQFLVVAGKNTIPFLEEDITNLVTIVLTTGATIMAWWKNNSFTKAAVEADEYLKELNED